MARYIFLYGKVKVSKACDDNRVSDVNRNQVWYTSEW